MKLTIINVPQKYNELKSHAILNQISLQDICARAGYHKSKLSPSCYKKLHSVKIYNRLVIAYNELLDENE